MALTPILNLPVRRQVLGFARQQLRPLDEAGRSFEVAFGSLRFPAGDFVSVDQ